MKNKRRAQKKVKGLFRSKQARRRALAKLPFDEKIRILIELQMTVSDIRATSGTARRRAWNIS